MPTTFFPLKPQGLGSRDIEALDSYLLRLATEHGVSEYQFHRVLAYWWNQIKADDKYSLAGHVTYITKIGYGRDIDTLVEAIERGTGISGLSGMTLSAFREVSGMHVGDVVRKTHQWCPACLHEWERTGVASYEKLLWRLKPITRCALHEVALEDRCPSCKSFQSRHEDTWPRCSSCGAHLAGDIHFWRRATRPLEGESDLFDVIEYCANHPGHVFDGDAARRFWQLIRRNAPPAQGATNGYFHQRPEPSRTLITVLLRFAQEMNVPLLSILLDPAEAAAIRPLIICQPTLHYRPKHQRFTAKERQSLRYALLRSLQSEHEAISLRKICRNHGCSQTIARYWYPELVKAVVSHKRAVRVDLLNDYQRRLKSLTLNEKLMARVHALGWHEATRELARDLDVPARLVRRRITILRENPRAGGRLATPQVRDSSDSRTGE